MSSAARQELAPEPRRSGRKRSAPSSVGALAQETSCATKRQRVAKAGDGLALAPLYDYTFFSDLESVPRPPAHDLAKARERITANQRPRVSPKVRKANLMKTPGESLGNLWRYQHRSAATPLFQSRGRADDFRGNCGKTVDCTDTNCSICHPPLRRLPWPYKHGHIIPAYGAGGGQLTLQQRLHWDLDEDATTKSEQSRAESARAIMIAHWGTKQEKRKYAARVIEHAKDDIMLQQMPRTIQEWLNEKRRRAHAGMAS